MTGDEPIVTDSQERPGCLAAIRRVLGLGAAGAHEGERFWGCVDDPRCRGVRVYQEAGEGFLGGL
jgi:hypothetical protein